MNGWNVDEAISSYLDVNRGPDLSMTLIQVSVYISRNRGNKQEKLYINCTLRFRNSISISTTFLPSKTYQKVVAINREFCYFLK